MRIISMAVILAAACGDDGGASGELLPDDYAATYTEVRDCRPSGGAHGLNGIRVLADPDALTPYMDRTTPFPAGSIVVKEEYGDSSCTGEIILWSVMQKLPEGSSPDTLDWAWQSIDPLRGVTGNDLPRCIGCHQGCTLPDGYDSTCTVP